jgi:hypothetical protein
MAPNLKAAIDADFRLGHTGLYHIRSDFLGDMSNVIKIENCDEF